MTQHHRILMFHLHQDRHLMQVHEAFVDLFSGRTARYNTLDPFNSGYYVPGHDDFGSGYVEDDDDYTDDDSDYEDRKDKKAFCGFPRNFLEHGPPRSRSPHPPHPLYRTDLQKIMHEQAEKNAKELVEEEERLKVKAEKKRLKKLRQKERKRKEKEKEQNNTDKNIDGDNHEVENSVVKSKFSNSESVCDKSADKAADAGPLKKTQAPTSVQNKPHSNGFSEDDEEEEYEQEEEDSEVESIGSELEVLDMNSCFVSKAATIAKRKLELKAKLEKREEKSSSSRKPALKQQQKSPQQKQQQKSPQQSGQWQLVEPRPRGVEPQLQQQRPRQHQQNAQVASIEDVEKRSTELAVIGNQLGNSGRFEMAVIYFTDAIKHNPKDFRLFGNRSFCYEKMQQYEKALIDADISLAMSPGWIKGLYRRGRALAGLKRYSDAAVAFKSVLQLDRTSSDAAQELMRVQIMQLMEMGFSKEQSSNALIIHGTVEKALEAFSNIQDEKFGSSSPPVANASQSAEEEWVVAGQKSQPPANQATIVPTQPLYNPRPKPPVKANFVKEVTPELFPVWVGNLVPTVTGNTVHSLFSTVGPVHSVKMLPSRRCAFVNYTRKGNCETAIKEFHGKGLEGAVLSVRYPDRIHPHLGASKSAKQATELPPEVVPKSVPTMPGECVFWRNSGCIKKERCTFLHIPSHKGIDRGGDKLAP
ncbi:uncharacterized protein si:dkey-33c12.4 isoform X2 [Conger conger]|uniref:uncharacterized protein si:dkey-33c12.4 isoform X2 n=1 Tax=Conger conger TaxID=82655 RepID=UPI002A5A19E0|nr:uncharacterized protein si:dkey-33c12.4 isoform X2 [Conger conger]